MFTICVSRDFKGHLGEFASDESDLDTPCGVFCFNDQVLVSDTGHHRVALYNIESRKYPAPLDYLYSCYAGCRIVKTFGSQGTAQGKLRRPMQLSVSVSGNLAVADSDNRRVSIWNVHQGEFLCCAGGKSKGRGAQDECFKASVQAVATTAAGAILVADTAASTIRMYQLASNESNGVRAVLERV